MGTHRLLFAVCLPAFVLLSGLIAVPIAFAQEAEADVLRGSVVHGGGLDGFDPSSLIVSLDVFEGAMDVRRDSTQPDASGNFEFQVEARANRFYFVTVEYQGARYSASLEAGNLDQTATVEVFESTTDPDVLSIETYTIIVTGAVPEEGFVEVLERAMVRNESSTTLVPDRDAQDAAMPGFLRFGLPSGYYNLDIGATLIGGSVLEVGEGFALDMPIPPTGEELHEFEFVYRVPYDSPELDLSRVMRFGAGTLRLVVPVDVGRGSSTMLEDLGVAEAGDRFLRLLEGRDIARGETLQFTVTELPMPSLWARYSRDAGEWYLRYGAPSLLAAAGLALFAFALIRRGRLTPLPAGLPAHEQHYVLVQRMADLDARYRAGAVPSHRYESERAHIRQALISLELQRRLPLDQT